MIPLPIIVGVKEATLEILRSIRFGMIPSLNWNQFLEDTNIFRPIGASKGIL